MGTSVTHMDSTTYAATVAANIRKAIKASGRSVLSVAEATGIAQSTLDRRFKSNGASPFTVLEVHAIAKELGTTARVFYADADEMAAA